MVYGAHKELARLIINSVIESAQNTMQLHKTRFTVGTGMKHNLDNFDIQILWPTMGSEGQEPKDDVERLAYRD